MAACAPAAIRAGQYTEVQPGIRLHYASCGEPGRPLLLFLHGFPEYWASWQALLPRFADRWFAVAPDLRGYNLSSKPAAVADYRARLLLADIDGLIAGLGYADADLVGHDWGGALAWAYAITRPRRLRRLVILNAPHPVPFSRLLAGDPAQQAASRYMNWLRRPGSEGALARDDFALLERFVAGVGGAPWLSGATRAAYHAAWSQPGALAGSVNYYRASPLYPPTDDDPGTARLALDPAAFRVSVPTLVIWGERDAALLPALLDGLDALVDDLRIVRRPQDGHWIVHESPEAVAALVREFLG